MSDVLRNKFIDWFLSIPDVDETLVEQCPNTQFKTPYMEGFFDGWCSNERRVTTLQADNDRLRDALEKLSLLEDGIHCGNGRSHKIAQQALAPQGEK